MKALRWLLASLVGLVGGIVALLGVVLCVTLILAPLGIPLLFLARRLFKLSGQLVVPRSVRHPIDSLQAKGSDAAETVRKRGRKAGKNTRKELQKKTGKKPGKKLRKKSERASKRMKKKLPIG